MPSVGSSPFKTTVEGVESYMLPALLTTIFCCMPFGVVALVYADKVNVAKEEDDLEAALDASRKARKWFRASIITAILINVVYFILRFLLGFFANTLQRPTLK